MRQPEVTINQMRRKTNEEFLKEVHGLVGDEYLFLENYKTTHVKLKVKHIKCGHIYNVSPANFLSGYRCPKCAREIMAKKQVRPVQDILNHLSDNGFKFIEFPDGYRNDKSKITVECTNGHISTKSVVAVMHHLGCPKCRSSKGEERIRGILLNLNVKFEEQYRFDDCRYKYPLPFDFAVFDRDDILSFLIEYDGEQHYIPFRTKDGEEKLKEVKRNDDIKSRYCILNNIKLVRIPYWEFDNIENIITDTINNHL